MSVAPLFLDKTVDTVIIKILQALTNSHYPTHCEGDEGETQCPNNGYDVTEDKDIVKNFFHKLNFQTTFQTRGNSVEFLIL